MRKADGHDVLYALFVWVLAFGLYVATLQPDLGGPEDTPKFQFLGYVLGTAHPPGYPLYVLLSHAFVQLPIGTIAYRANLFSAVMAALACALAYVMARQLGSGRWPAICAAAALATGACFWRSAVFAGVYSLAAVMAALTVTFLLAWGANGGAFRLVAAAAAFGLGLGNHLTIVGILPACALYVLVGGRTSLTSRVVLSAAGVVLLCLSQYGFIILRTHQGAPYLESQASSLPELLRVVTAERFATERFAFTVTELTTVHGPKVVSLIADEVGIAGLALIGSGLIAAVFQRRGSVALVAGAAAGMLAMVLNLSGDRAGFITPVVALLWPLGAFGLEVIARRLQAVRISDTSFGTAVLILAVALPITNVIANFEAADQSEQRADAHFVRSVYGQLPDRAAIIAEDDWFDMAIQYLMLTGEDGPARERQRIGFRADAVREAAKEKRRVFAFAGAARFLEAEGLRFKRAGFVGPPLEEWLDALPKGAVIIGATTNAPIPPELKGNRREDPNAQRRARRFTAFALAGREMLAWHEDDGVTALALDAEELKVPRLKRLGDILAAADPRGARIEMGGRTIVQIDDGLALAAFTLDGRLLRTLDAPAGQPVRGPLHGAVYELDGEAPCVNITTDRWTDLTPAFVTGSWLTTMPVFGSVVVEHELWGPVPLNAVGRELLGGGTVRTIGLAKNTMGIEVLVTELARQGSRPVLRLAADSPGVQGRARLRSGGAQASLRLCAQVPRPLFRRQEKVAVVTSDYDAEAYFGAGWSNAERTPNGYVRRSDHGGTLLLPLAEAWGYKLSLDLVGTGRVEVSLNRMLFGVCELPDPAPCEVNVPPGWMLDGINAVTISAPSGPVTFREARIRRNP